MGLKEERTRGRPPGLQEKFKGQGPMGGLIGYLKAPLTNGITIVLRVILSRRKVEVEGNEGVVEGEEAEGQVEEAGTGDAVGGAVGTYLLPESDTPLLDLIQYNYYIGP